MDTKRIPSRSERKNRWEPKTFSGDNNYYDDLNDRETVDYGESAAGARRNV